jgi:DNA adenine methylase
MADRNSSPLRYPGGKNCLTEFLTEIALVNNLTGGIYMELFAGGAGAALNLLFNGTYRHIHINDYDSHIFTMWNAILNYTEDFLQKIEETEITITEWHRQRQIFDQADINNVVELGFSTFFLNRTNRSGIIFKAGPIGGLEQNGNYLIDVRFNKAKLIERIRKIATYRNQITITNQDAVTLINDLGEFYPGEQQLFLYLDPPYYKKGKLLYMNNYAHEDHLQLRQAVDLRLREHNWIISYDNVPEIRQIYEGYRMSAFDLKYSLQSKKFGSELLVFSDKIRLCENLTIHNRSTAIELL